MAEHNALSLRGLARFSGKRVRRIRVKAAIPSKRATPEERGREQKKGIFRRESVRRRGQTIPGDVRRREEIEERRARERAGSISRFDPNIDLEGIFGGFGQATVPPVQPGPAAAPGLAQGGVSPMMLPGGGAAAGVNPDFMAQILESAQGLISPADLKKLTEALQRLLPS